MMVVGIFYVLSIRRNDLDLEINSIPMRVLLLQTAVSIMGVKLVPYSLFLISHTFKNNINGYMLTSTKIQFT